jgi:hypothetical protein
VRVRRQGIRAAAVALAATLLTGCSEFVIVVPTPTPEPLPSLPPIGFNHRYGNNPVASADGLAYERMLYASQVFWEVGLRTDPQLAGFVDRSDPNAVTTARSNARTLLVSLATERLATIRGMLALPSDEAQKTYCVSVVDHLRGLGYTNLTKVTVLMFFTEQDEHAQLTWTPQAGYVFRIFDNNLKGNAIGTAPGVTPLPAPG